MKAMQKMAIRFAALSAILVLAVPFVHPVSTINAQSKEDVCEGLGGGGCADDAEDQIGTIITAALNVFSTVVGIAGVIMVLIGGYKYLSSGGDSSKTASARGTIIWALIGLIVAAMAQVLVRFVLSEVPD